MNPVLSYERWMSDNKNALRRLAGKNVLLLFTGGKDCSLLLHFIQRAQSEIDFKLRVVAGTFPNHCFRKKEAETIRRYWELKGINIEFHSIEKTDRKCDAALKTGGNPCNICHGLRLAYLSKLADQYGKEKKSLAVVFGFTLWDLVSYSLEYLLGNEYAASCSESLFQGAYARDRFTNRTSQRFSLLRRSRGGYYVYNPLIFYNDNEIIEALNKCDTKLLTLPCRYSNYRPKRMFSKAYEAMGMRFDYPKVKAFVEKAFLK